MNVATELRGASRDRGTVLPLVLVVSVVLSIVVVGIATYASTTVKLGQAVERSSKRVAAAEGGLDWAIDRYRRGLTTCDSATGSELTTFEGEINGLNAEVSCQVVGSELPGAGKYALVLTGEELSSTPPALLRRSGANSEAKEIRGPVYMETPTIDVNAPLTLRKGWLLHRDLDCTGDFVSSDVVLPTNFSIIDGAPYCSQQSWTDLFLENSPQAALPSAPPALPPMTDPNGCVVWSPGRYDSTNVPDFDSASGGGPTYNYFISGNYYFDDILLEMKDAYVLAGYPGVRGPDIFKVKPGDTFDNNPCREAWWYDGFESSVDTDGDPQPQGDRSGATWYLGGSSRISVDANAALEISGRPQSFNGGATAQARVSLQALDDTTVRGASEILTTSSGNGKQMAMRGLVWTPYSSMNFSNLANDVIAALQGGAVVSTIDISAAAQTDGFLIEVSSQPFETQLMVESTATNSSSATVRALLDYQPSPPDVSIISRRMLDITPDS